MKVAILTFAVTNNYGATLQCYAMQEFLRSQGHETLILNVPLQKAGASRVKRTIWSRIKDKIYRTKIKIVGQTEGRYIRTQEEMKQDKVYESKNMELFNICRDKHFINLTHPYIDEEDFLYDYPEADAYIVGSDQVWNPWVTNYQYPLFFLSFVKANRKKISYAACMGGDTNFKFKDKEIKRIKELVSKFNAISVRDKTAINILKKRFNTDAIEVLDPTFLVDVKTYDAILNDSDIDAKGCLFSFKFIINDAWVKVIKSMAKNMNLDIRMDSCVIPIEGLPFHPECGVADWLRLIKTSDFIFTDSFHGMVFCILFKKNFVATPSYKGGEERYIDLAKKFGLEDRIYFSANEVLENKDVWMKPIDYDKVQAKYNLLQEISKKYIINALSM